MRFPWWAGLVCVLVVIGSLGCFEGAKAPVNPGAQARKAALTVTTTADFALGGNNEGGALIDANRVRRGLPSSDVGAWGLTTAFATPREGPATVAHNGVLYVLGGSDGINALGDVQMSTIAPDGTLSAWAATTPLPSPRAFASAVAYNGSLYVLGGWTGTVYLDEVHVALINADGTLGPWRPASRFSGTRRYHAAAAHLGYLYVIGGESTGGNYVSDVQVAAINGDGTLGTWQTTTSLPSVRASHASVAYNGYLYVLGGQISASVYLSEVRVARIGTDGALGSWISTTAFPSARRHPAAVASNGALFLVGGDSTILLNEVRAAPINADGTLGAWSVTSPFTTARRAHGAVAHRGHLYILGGWTQSANLNDVQVAPFTGTHSWAPGVGPWTAGPNLPSARNNHQAVARQNHLYLLGGGTATTFERDVWVSTLGSDGKAGPWTATTPFGEARYGHIAVAYKSWLYVIAGRGSSGPLNDVQVAPINADGSVGAWNVTAPLPSARLFHGAAVVDGRIYVLGGETAASGYLNDVWVGPINGDGTVSAWTMTTPFQTARATHSAVAYNGALYVLAGWPGVGFLSDVQFARANGDGTLPAWAPTTPLTVGRFHQTALAANGALYVLGGFDGSAVRNDVQVAPLNDGGTAGSWTASTPFANGRDSFASATDNGFLYVLGGWNNPTRFDDLQVAPLLGPLAVGVYSKLIDFGTDTQINALTVNGGAALRGVVRVAYRTAPSSAVFGPLVGVGEVTLGTPVPLGAVTARYLWVRLTLDDLGSMPSGPGASFERDVTDFTVSHGLLQGSPCGLDTECQAPLVCRANVCADEVDAGEIDAGTVDAGELDAGEVDAGTVDAGELDAGEVDAGTVDAGEVDAGFPPGDGGITAPDGGGLTSDGGGAPEVLRLATGCDCSSAGATGWALLAMAFWLRRRSAKMALGGRRFPSAADRPRPAAGR